MIRQKRRERFERYLQDPDACVRAYAERISARDLAERRELADATALDEAELELAWEAARSAELDRVPGEPDASELPF